MKYKKTMILLSAFIITFIYIIHPTIVESEDNKDELNKDIIRFHIRANSDKKEDQELKLKVRDEILKDIEPKFKDNKSTEESRHTILENMDNMKSIAEDVIENEGKDYTINVSLGQDSFPIRKYGNIVLPQGEYETLMIEIGEAKGENWWCVMFPPLCFIDETHAVDIEDSENDQLGEFVVDDERPLQFKSKIVDFFKNIVTIIS
ncbi:MAG TPA: stage II sporulation protein R [Tissierellaceae bacterium]|nr:stage II sporulation protein R [Tissierellaceae bacterium]